MKMVAVCSKCGKTKTSDRVRIIDDKISLCDDCIRQTFI